MKLGNFYPKPAGGFEREVGSGIAISSKHVLTAGHNLYDWGLGVATANNSILGNFSASDTFTVSSSNPPTLVPGSQSVTLANSSSHELLYDYDTHTVDDLSRDLGYIKLASTTFDVTKLMGLVTYINTEDIAGEGVTTAGYPGDARFFSASTSGGVTTYASAPATASGTILQVQHSMARTVPISSMQVMATIHLLAEKAPICSTAGPIRIR